MEENEKPYNAPMMRIFKLNQPEWPLNLIGNLTKIMIVAVVNLLTFQALRNIYEK